MDPINFTIPILGNPDSAGTYGTVAVDGSDIRLNDPLVRLDDFGVACESFYGRTDGQNWPYHCRIAGSLQQVWCRLLVAKRLQFANALLREHQAELFVWDAYRPIEVQTGLWSFFWSQILEAMPEATEIERRAYMSCIMCPIQPRFNPSDSTTWLVHTSGGAVDLTLRSLETGAMLDMGAEFDGMHEISHSSALERRLAKREISDSNVALLNRRLQHWAMEEAGFVNYPFEYWHFDWG
jgi:D-alanyl-D-alanine dipeptidase